MSCTPTLDHFFRTALDYYLIPDLKRLRTEVRPRGDKEGCTIPTAMLAFSLLDLIGFLMRPEPASKRDTYLNIEYALNKKAGLFSMNYAVETPALVKVFRHGIMHQVFPKACGISKPRPSNHDLIFFGLDGTPNLNVDVLVDDLLAALGKLRGKVKEDSSLAVRMDRRLVSLQQEDYDVLQEVRLQDGGLASAGKLDTHDTASTTTTTTT